MPKVECPTCNGLGFIHNLDSVEPSLHYPEGYNLRGPRATPDAGPPKLSCKQCKGQGWVEAPEE